MYTSKIALFASLAFATACSSSSTGTPATTADDSGAASTVTFTKVYTDIISPICVVCHNPAGVGVSVGKLDMSSQATAVSNLVGVAAAGVGCSGMGTRVVAGNAGSSILYQKVTAPTCGSQMPLNGTPLTPDQADEIKAWINAGATND
jgi:mono/diheme cytochrome c family protein